MCCPTHHPHPHAPYTTPTHVSPHTTPPPTVLSSHIVISITGLLFLPPLFPSHYPPTLLPTFCVSHLHIIHPALTSHVFLTSASPTTSPILIIPHPYITHITPIPYVPQPCIADYPPVFHTRVLPLILPSTPYVSISSRHSGMPSLAFLPTPPSALGSRRQHRAHCYTVSQSLRLHYANYLPSSGNFTCKPLLDWFIFDFTV